MLPAAALLTTAALLPALPASPAGAQQPPVWNSITTPVPASDPGTDPPVPTSGEQETAVSATSCVSLSFCVAVGSWDVFQQYALVDTFTGGQWTALAAPAPADDPDGSPASAPFGYPWAAALDAVTCTSQSFCVAVGSYTDSNLDDSGGTTTWGLIETWSGSGWTSLAAPMPASDLLGTDDVTSVDLDGVSCTSSSFCVAAGRFEDSDGTWGLLERFDGTAWSALTAPEPGSNPSGEPPRYTEPLYPVGTVNDDASLASVACSSPEQCVAAGSYLDAGGTAGYSWGLIEAWSGSSWSPLAAPEPSTDPAGTVPGSDADRAEDADLDAVACDPGGGCVAAGSYDDAAGVQWAELVSGSAASWTALAPAEPSIDADDVGPLDATGDADGATFAAVACPADGACDAVGSYTDADGGVWPLTESLSGGTWTPGTVPDPSPGPGVAAGSDAGGTQDASLAAVSCSAPASCEAVGLFEDEFDGTWPLVDTIAADAGAASEGGSLPGGAGFSLAAVSCGSDGACLGAGDVGGVPGDTYGASSMLDMEPAPVVSAVTPGQAPAGATVTVSGSGFTPDSVVLFGSDGPATTIYESSSQLEAEVPAVDDGFVEVTVDTAGVVSVPSEAGDFVWSNPAPATVPASSPAGGPLPTTTSAPTTTVPPAGTSAPVTAPPGSSRRRGRSPDWPALSGRNSVATVHEKVLSLRLSCPHGPCTGELELSAALRAGVSSAEVFASGRYAIRSGHAVAVALHLGAAGVALLAAAPARGVAASAIAVQGRLRRVLGPVRVKDGAG